MATDNTEAIASLRYGQTNFLGLGVKQNLRVAISSLLLAIEHINRLLSSDMKISALITLSNCYFAMVMYNIELYCVPVLVCRLIVILIIKSNF